VTYEAIADRKIGHAALRPEICSGIVGEVRGLNFGKGKCSFEFDLAGKLINIVGPACRNSRGLPRF